MDNILESLKPLAVPIDSVKLDERNARLHPQPNLEAIKRSLSFYGQRKPIVVREEDGVIEAGNGMWMAAKELGWTEIAATVVKDDSETATGYALMDNQSALLADWDYPILKNLLEELDNGIFDMDLTGFDEKAIEELMTQVHEAAPGLTDEDAVPDAPEPVCKPGDLWTLGAHRLLCGDATVITDVERLMGGEKADMVFTDPPYGMNLTTDWSDVVGSLKLIGGKHKTKGNIYKPVIGDDDAFDPCFIMTFFNYVVEQFWFGADYYAERIIDKNKGSWLVWDKRKESQAEAIGSEFELIWSKVNHKRRVLRHDWFGFLSSLNTKEAQERLHPTQKPTSLIIDIITQWGNKCEIIADPFGGSGSTLIVCEKLGRRCFMMEIAPHYCDVIIKRWEEYTGKKAELANAG